MSLPDGLSAPGMYSWQVAVPINVVPGIYQLALLQGDEDPVFSPGFTLAIPAAVSMQTTNAPTTDIPFPTVAAGAGAPITTATATTTATTTVTAIYLNTATGLTIAPNMTNATIPMPIEQFITYIYWEDSCACHQTSSCPASALPTSMSTTTVTYSEKECGCTKTVAAPCAETTIPVAAVPTVMPAPPSSTAPVVAMSSSSVTPVMTTPAPVSPVAPANTSPMTYTGAAERVVASSLAFLAMVGALVLA